MRVRRVVVTINTPESDALSTFSYPEANLGFSIKLSGSDEPETCFVKISGIDKYTYQIFKQSKDTDSSTPQRVSVYYGYDDELSLVFDGTIDRAMYSFEGGAQTLMLNVTRNARKFTKQVKPISLTGSQTIRSAIDNICKEFGATATYSNNGDFDSINIGRYCGTTTLQEALKEVLPAGYGFYHKEDSIYIYAKDKSTPTEITIWSENGLLAYPTEDSEGKKTTIKTILIPGAEAGMKIHVPVDDVWFSPTYTGTNKTFVVHSFSSSFSNGIGTSEFECEGGIDL